MRVHNLEYANFQHNMILIFYEESQRIARFFIAIRNSPHLYGG